MSLPKRLFITGTDTGVGKTMVSAILALGFKAKYWKAIQTGVEDGTDTEWIQQVTGLPANHFYPERYRCFKPLSPHAAAALDRIEIALSDFRPPGPATEPLIVEGAGGVMVPINGSQFMLDVMRKLALPVLVVARSGLGTINHTLLTLQCLRAAELQIAGVVMNGERNSSNRQAIEQYGKVDVIAEIQPLEVISRERLWNVFEQQFGVKV